LSRNLRFAGFVCLLPSPKHGYSAVRMSRSGSHEEHMGAKSLAVVIAALSVAFVASPAEAKPKKQTVVTADGGPVYRGRQRITIVRRSYLDAGTEVLPGARKFTDYVTPPGYSPYSIYDPNGQWRSPLPNSFWLP